MKRISLFNYLAAAVLKGLKYTDSHRTSALDLDGAWMEESIDTLRRFPMDRVNWRMTNSHRKDLRRGARLDGRVLPIDERYVNHWNHDPWRVDQGGNGQELASGAAFFAALLYGPLSRVSQRVTGNTPIDLAKGWNA